MIVTEDYRQPDVKLDYTGTSNSFSGFDRFGRIVDQVWKQYGSSPSVLDEYTYTYDRSGNRTAKTNALDTALDETYDYNDLGELVSSSRADDFDQSWTLDGLGNFSGFNNDGARKPERPTPPMRLRALPAAGSRPFTTSRAT